MTKKDKKTEETPIEENQSYTQADIDAYQNALNEAQTLADSYLEDLQRERASFANYKRRIDQDNLLVADIEFARSVSAFLPVVDDLELALKNQPGNSECQAWAKGIELILQKLRNTLAKHNVEVLDIAPGDEFDPNYQEALTHEEDETYQDGQIIEVVLTGYKLKDRIIRPASVRVAK